MNRFAVHNNPDPASSQPAAEPTHLHIVRNKEEDSRPITDLTVGELKNVFTESMFDFEALKAEVEASASRVEEARHQNFATKALGTVGDVAHGVVDVAEGVLRGAIDVVTLGYSKK